MTAEPKTEKPYYLYNPVKEKLENVNDPNFGKSEKPIKEMADKIIDKNYQQNKNKSPFTQSAEIAKDLLSFELKDGFIANKDNRRVDTVKEAIEFNEALDKNFRDHKQDDYLKMAKLPIVRNNINNKIPKAAPKPLNKYQMFRENQKIALEEKEFNKKFEADYGNRAIEKDLRDKENANRRAGRAPHEGFSSSQQIVAEHAKDRAKKILKALKTDPIKIEPTYIDYRLKPNDPGPTISFEEHMAKTAPIEPEPPGITGLEEVKNFRNIIDMTDQKFPKKARGIGPFISGEDD